LLDSTRVVFGAGFFIPVLPSPEYLVKLACGREFPCKEVIYVTQITARKSYCGIMGVLYKLRTKNQ